MEMFMDFAGRGEKKWDSKWRWTHQLTQVLKKSFIFFQRMMVQEWWFSKLAKVHYSDYYSLFFKTKWILKKAFCTMDIFSFGIHLFEETLKRKE